MLLLLLLLLLTLSPVTPQVLILEDYAQISETLLRQAYIEAIYRANNNEWEFERLTQRWWHHLIYTVLTPPHIHGININSYTWY